MKTRSLQLIAIVLILGSCHTYYRDLNSVPKKAHVTSGEGLDSLQRIERYFILRNLGRSWHMDSLVLSADGKSFSFNLEETAPEHQLHLQKGKRPGKQDYRPGDRNQKLVVKEVHLYVKSFNQVSSTGTNHRYTLLLNQVEKIEVLEKDKKRTTNSHVGGFLLGTLVAGVVVTGIAILTKGTSCPFVSTFNGKEFVLQGEVFGGAIYPQLARHDYLPLQVQPSEDGALRMIIHNELKEIQHTDMARLMVATHPKDVEVLIDPQGLLHTMGIPQRPESANLGDKDVTASVLAIDENIMLMNDSSQETGVNEVSLRFKNPTGARHAKLVLRLKNSMWLDVLYGELSRGFGTAYQRYVDKQKSATAASLEKWVVEQNVPMKISINRNGAWSDQHLLKPVGPIAYRKITIPLETDGLENLHVKLSSGFLFWDIDYAAIDFSEDLPVEMVTLLPETAEDQDGNDVRKILSYDDKVYLDQPNVGDSTMITYTIPNLEDTSRARSYYLHAVGYYEPIRRFETKPELKFLKPFRKPNALSAFSVRLYNRQRELLKMASITKN